jgi:putative Ca2+/H+ antiporter (TMEM165/GDT1 family)
LAWAQSRVEQQKLMCIQKPADLPEKPHDIPHPKPPTIYKDDPLSVDHSSGSPASSSSSLGHHDHDDEIPDAGSSLHSLVFSFTMILVSEIGDKTFLVAALMAMRHPRLVVFSAAFSALIGMTVLSAVLGHAVPTLIPKTFTKFMAAILFLVFGAKMLKEGREMSPDEGVGEEMREVEAELEEKEHQQLRMGRRRSSVTPHNLEAGRAGGRPKTRGSGNRLPSPPESISSSSSRGSSPHPRQRLNDAFSGLSNLFSLLLSPAWVQTFVMTFLGEWGDRSQIATIAMAAGQDYWWVTVGASAGHGICTAAAVIGGRAIAGRVSMRVGMYLPLEPLSRATTNDNYFSDSRRCRGIPCVWRHLLH